MNPETAFYDVSARVGGTILFDAIAVILFIACLGSGLAGQVGAARLLFAMGRDNIVPRKIFAHLNVKSATPNYNILIMGGLTLIGSLLLSYQGAAELLNFGAFLAFMGVNIASFRQFFFLRPLNQKPSLLLDLVFPILGMLVCFAIWISLPLPAKIIGGIWLLIGFIYLVVKTKGLKLKPSILDLKDV